MLWQSILVLLHLMIKWCTRFGTEQNRKIYGDVWFLLFLVICNSNTWIIVSHAYRSHTLWFFSLFSLFLIPTFFFVFIKQYSAHTNKYSKHTRTYTNIHNIYVVNKIHNCIYTHASTFIYVIILCLVFYLKKIRIAIEQKDKQKQQNYFLRCTVSMNLFCSDSVLMLCVFEKYINKIMQFTLFWCDASISPK